MSEHLPSPEQEPKTDEDLINDAILQANKRRTVISNEAARVIASQLHGGQSSSLYALTSSGAIVDGLLEEIDRDMCSDKVEPIARYWAEKLEMYAMVRIQNAQTDPVEGWDRLWLGAERKRDRVLISRAQALYDVEAGYQAFITDFTRDELLKLWGYCGSGLELSFDDEVFDALHQQYGLFNSPEKAPNE